jgi:hypothetical protein
LVSYCGSILGGSIFGKGAGGSGISLSRHGAGFLNLNLSKFLNPKLSPEFFFATVGAGCNVVDLIEMRTDFIHGIFALVFNGVIDNT